MNMHALIEDTAQATLAWQEAPAALRWLAEINAAERSADTYSGRGWHNVAESFSSHAADAEMELEQLRDDACNAAANSVVKFGDPDTADAWHDAHDAASETMTSVKDAIKQARRDCAGDALFEQAEAA